MRLCFLEHGLAKPVKIKEKNIEIFSTTKYCNTLPRSMQKNGHDVTRPNPSGMKTLLASKNLSIWVHASCSGEEHSENAVEKQT